MCTFGHGWENRIGCAALNILALEVSHARKRFVCKDHSKLIVNDDYTFIEFLQDRPHLAKPIGSLDGRIMHGFARSNMVIRQGRPDGLRGRWFENGVDRG